MNNLLESGFRFSGLDMLYSGDLPIGAGLSSSASIEVLTAYALNELFQHTLSKKEIALLSQKVENEFIGVNCGIMDQFSVALGKKDQAILLDCETLAYDYIPCELHQYSLLVINTNKQRRLTDSKYNERFAQCRSALDLIRKDHSEVRNLCDLTTKQFESFSHLIRDPVLVQRVKHVVSACPADAARSYHGTRRRRGGRTHSGTDGRRPDQTRGCPRRGRGESTHGSGLRRRTGDLEQAPHRGPRRYPHRLAHGPPRRTRQRRAAGISP